MPPTCAGAAPLAFVANGSDSSVTVVDTATDTVVGEPIPVADSPLAITLNPSGSTAYVTGIRDGRITEISVIDAAASRVVATVPLSYGATDIAVTLDEKRVYVLTYLDRSLWEIDAETNAIVGDKFSIGDSSASFTSIALTSDGTRAYVTDAAAQTVKVVDLVERETIGAIQGIGGPPSSSVISPDGKWLYVVTTNGRVAVIDTVAGAVVGEPIQRDNALFTDLVITPEGDRLYMHESRSGKLLTFDTNLRAFIGTDIVTGPSAGGIALTADGKRAYVSGGIDQIVVVDLVARAWNHVIFVGNDPSSLAIQPPAPCAGDCRRKGSVTVDDLVTAVLISSSQKQDFFCALADADDDGQVTTDEITSAVTRALGGCSG